MCSLHELEILAQLPTCRNNNNFVILDNVFNSFLSGQKNAKLTTLYVLFNNSKGIYSNEDSNISFKSTGRPSDGLVNDMQRSFSVDSNDRIMPHKSLNLRSFVPKKQRRN